MHLKDELLDIEQEMVEVLGDLVTVSGGKQVQGSLGEGGTLHRATCGWKQGYTTRGRCRHWFGRSCALGHWAKEITCSYEVGLGDLVTVSWGRQEDRLVRS